MFWLWNPSRFIDIQFLQFEKKAIILLHYIKKLGSPMSEEDYTITNVSMYVKVDPTPFENRFQLSFWNLDGVGVAK